MLGSIWPNNFVKLTGIWLGGTKSPLNSPLCKEGVLREGEALLVLPQKLKSKICCLITTSKYMEVSHKVQLMRYVRLIAPVLLLVTGMSIQMVTLPFWIKAFLGGIGGPYFILCWASLLFTCFYGVAYSATVFVKDLKRVSVRQYAKNYLGQGLANALNGIFIVYSSPISRTPPVLLLVITNLGLVFGMILTRFLTQKRHNYCQLKPIVSLVMLFLSIVIMIIGNLVHNVGENQFTYYTIMWMFFVTIGSFCGSLYNVLQERYLTDSNTELKTKKGSNGEFIRNFILDLDGTIVSGGTLFLDRYYSNLRILEEYQHIFHQHLYVSEMLYWNGWMWLPECDVWSFVFSRLYYDIYCIDHY